MISTRRNWSLVQSAKPQTQPTLMSRDTTVMSSPVQCFHSGSCANKWESPLNQDIPLASQPGLFPVTDLEHASGFSNPAQHIPSPVQSLPLDAAAWPAFTLNPHWWVLQPSPIQSIPIPDLCKLTGVTVWHDLHSGLVLAHASMLKLAWHCLVVCLQNKPTHLQSYFSA